MVDDTELHTLPAAQWDIGDMSQEGTLEINYAPSGAGKSTFCAQRACCKTTGIEFFGKPIQHPAPVVIVALEGVSALGKKITSWKRRHGFEDTERIGIYIVHEYINLLDIVDVVRVSQLVKRVRGGELFVDTLAQSIVADEDNEAFQQAATNAAIIRSETQARVVLVHHSGKDRKRGARGGSSLTAAADTVISIDEYNGHHVVKCEKQRDGRRFEPFFLRLVPDDLTAHFEQCEGQPVPLAPDNVTLQREILDWLQEHPYATGSTIAAHMHKQKAAVLDALNSLLRSGRVQCRAQGRARFWAVSNGSQAEGES